MTETLANGYSSESTQRELSNEYQHDRDKMVFKNLCVLMLWTKVASILKGLSKKIFTSTMLVEEKLFPLHIVDCYVYLGILLINYL